MTARISLLAVAAALVVVAGAAAPAAAEETARTARADTAARGAGADGELTPRDRAFIEDMAKAGLAEIAAGKVAADRASDLAVKQFGEQMVKDHTEANHELGEIAAASGMTLPTELEPAQRREIAALEQLSPTELDRRYIQLAAREHPQAQKLFDEAARSADDEELRDFAKDQVKAIGRHIEMARSVGHSAGNLAPAESGKEPFRAPRAGTEG